MIYLPLFHNVWMWHVRMLVSMAALLSLLGSPILADVKDPLDPFSQSESPDESEADDANKSAEELLAEAATLLEDTRPLDARSKLLRVLEKNPKEYRAHLMLSQYYMGHVGHFRLALKYVRQAQALFEQEQGRPPYSDYSAKARHAQILYLLSQARLNLDDYQGSLRVLDEYASYGYFQDWYPGTRSWVLMKLGRLDEAIREARLGIYTDAEPGRTMNMLGILLSMTGDRMASIEIFKQAIKYELSMGSLGQAATPLNNVGEVYEEIFQEEDAKLSYLKATRLPDGCEHVLPSLNLAKLYLDELDFEAARDTMNNFESCVAQFPLRNGEEHRALVHLARGRIALHTGFADQAIEHFRAALDKRQWFGKIGTSQDDLRAGALVSLAQALRTRSHISAFRRDKGIADWAEHRAQMMKDSVEAWWHLRRARQILVEDLSRFEDLYIRNTDSMLEYPTLGELLADIEPDLLRARIKDEEGRDGRPESKTFYRAYLAENYLRNGYLAEARELLDTVLSSTRSTFDDALRVHTLTLRMSLFDEHSSDYAKVAQEVFALSRAALRNYGLALPVNFTGDASLMRDLFDGTPFQLDNALKLEYAVSYEFKEGEHQLQFGPTAIPGRRSRVGTIVVKSNDIDEAVNHLADEVFSFKL